VTDVKAEIRAFYERIAPLAEGAPPLSHIWRANLPWVKSQLADRTSDGARTPQRHPESVWRPPAVQRRIIELSMAWYETLLERLGCNPLAQPFPVRPDAARIARALETNYPSIALGGYEHFYSLALFERYCPALARRAADPAAERVVVAEIGTIFGGLARMMLTKYPNLTYVFIDIPESLCVTAHDFMLGRKARLVASAEELAATRLQDHECVFVPSMLAAGLAGKPIELVWTFHSLGEFSNASIAFYYDLIERGIRPRWFAHRSRFLNGLDEGNFRVRAGENMAGVLTGPDWAVRHWKLEPEINACPYVSPARHPRYLEVALERGSDIGGGDADKRGFLARVSLEGWIDILRKPQSYTMTWGLRPLRFDPEWSGAFARFWDHARRAPGRDIFLMFAHYLDYCALGSARPYEEWLFYAAILLRLHAEAPDETSEAVRDWIGSRIAEAPRSTFKPLPLLELGFVPPPEILPEARVRAIMSGTDVPRTLGLG
jgi:hypothetical protein